MTIGSILATAGITVTAAIGVITWLIRTFIEHRLAKAMEKEKTGFAEALGPGGEAATSEGGCV